MTDDKESVQRCDLEPSKKARKKARKMDCGQLLEKIKELMDKERKGRSGTKGLKQRFRDYKGDDATHGPTIINQQRSLLTYLEEYDNKNCGDPPSGAKEWADKRLPEPRSEHAKDIAKGVAVGVGVVALGYITYRVIRFLPSLLPPLWPTIPLNLAIP